jgi:hypothetical protein
MITMPAVEPSLDEITRSLAQRWGASLTPSSRDKDCTCLVTNALYELGQPHYLVCSHGCKEQGEWLLDLIWMDRQTQAIILAVESEWWKLNAVREDSAKLMCVKAPQKLMLFNTYDHCGSEEFVSALARDMERFPFHVPGETYFLMEVTRPGVFRYAFTVPEGGTLSKVTFAPVEPNPLPWVWATH